MNVGSGTTQCPDFSSHSQNALDQWSEVHGRQPQTVEDHEQIDAIAEAEYQICEGH